MHRKKLHKDKIPIRVVLYSVFLTYFFIDLFVGCIFATIINKINLLDNLHHYHFSITPLVNILSFNLQMKMFRGLPYFSMKLYYSAVYETSLGFGITILLGIICTIYTISVHGINKDMN